MIAYYLAVENDIAVYEKESAAWAKHQISSHRVSSLNEAIEAAMKQPYYFISINASNVNYEPKLELLRAVTNDPIFIATKNYSAQEQCHALMLGADLYWELGDKPEDNFALCTAMINRLNDHAKKKSTRNNYNP